MDQLINPQTGQPYRAKNEFVYVTQISSDLVNNGSTSSSFNIDGDSDFFWTKTAAFALVASDGTTVSDEELPAVAIVITNTTTGRQYMNNAVPIPSIAGSARLPFILPMITYLQAKSTITVDYTGLNGNKDYSYLALSFIGIKAFF